MSIYPITIYGDQILREKVKPVKKIDDSIIGEVQNMFQTMRHASGIGLAANQVNKNKSMFVIDISPVEGYEKFKPVVMINPEIIELSDDTVFMEEGCLSLPNLRAEVERSEAVKIKYLTADEEEIEEEYDDLMARVILHEYDHLIGKMIPDRVDKESRKKMQRELVRMMRRDIEVDYPITERKR